MASLRPIPASPSVDAPETLAEDSIMRRTIRLAPLVVLLHLAPTAVAWCAEAESRSGPFALTSAAMDNVTAGATGGSPAQAGQFPYQVSLRQSTSTADAPPKPKVRLLVSVQLAF